MDANTASTGIPWYIWALMTVICWGTYGVCMHTGSMKMDNQEHGRIMAFLWVGLAYFLTAVIAPIIILKVKILIYFYEFVQSFIFQLIFIRHF